MGIVLGVRYEHWCSLKGMLNLRKHSDEATKLMEA